MPTQFNNSGGFAGFGNGIGARWRRQAPQPGDPPESFGIWRPQDSVSDGWYNPDPTPIPGVSGVPRPTPSPAPTATPPPTQTGGASEFYEDNSGVSQNTPSVTVYPSGPDYAGTQGDNFYSGNFGDEDDYSHTPGAEIPRLEPSFLFGGPSVETPTSSGSYVNLDDEPSLFPSGSNAFDEWWRTDPVTGSAEVSASVNTGGSIWSGDDTLSNFGNDVALGNDLNASLDSLGYGEDYPAVESPFADSPFTPIAEDTGIPVEPDPLNQDVGDLEWTRTEDDRRFLPEPTQSVASSGGSNIRDFGGHSFNTPLSLGAYLNMSLTSLRYGEGYPITYGGRPSDLQAGEGYIDPGSQTGGHWVDTARGQIWVEDSPGSTGFTPEGAPGTGTSGQGPSGPGTPQQQGPSLNSILAQFPGLNNPAGIRALNAGAQPGDLVGRSQFDSHAANSMLMASQAFGGNANVISVNDEERVMNSAQGSRFFPGRNEGARHRALQGLYPHGLHTNMGLAGTGGGG